jgi:hypothetical protein
MLTLWPSSKPIVHINRLVGPTTATRLGDKLLGLRDLHEVGEEPEEYRFNRLLSNASLRDGRSPQEALGALCARLFERDPEGAQLLFGVASRALRRMRGLQPGGLNGMSPAQVSLDVNAYHPGETFATHDDKGAHNDVVPITLQGDGARFMHVVGARRGTMPASDQVVQAWDLSPGQAVSIRNHGLRNEWSYRWPLHAVQNGDQERLTLQVQVSYD